VLQLGFSTGRFQAYAKDMALDVEIRVVLPRGVTEIERRRHRHLPVAGNQVQLRIDVRHEFAIRDWPIEDPDGSVRQDVELTPRHSAGIVGTWEREHSARIGLEAYYTGTQRLDDNPYRTESRPYVLFGFLVEKTFGRFKAYLNAENLGDVRQTKYDPLLRPTRGVDGRWTTDAWAPLDGRVFNGGLRASF